MLSQVAKIQPRLRALHALAADGLNEALDQYVPLVQQVIEQTRRRVLRSDDEGAVTVQRHSVESLCLGIVSFVLGKKCSRCLQLSCHAFFLGKSG